MSVSFTRRGYIELFRDGVRISRHTAAEEAYERAVEHAKEYGPGRYTVRYPDREIDVGAFVIRSSIAPTPAAVAYFWDDLAPDYIVDPSRTTNGTGSEASPFQPSQVISINGTGGTSVNPSGQRVIFEWLPGNLDYSDPRSADYRYPYFRPANGYGGASGQPVIHRARYKAADPAVNSSNYTSIRRTGGMGSILGSGTADNPTISDVYFDGFNLPTWGGSAGTESEVFMFSNWNVNRGKGVRLRLDGESAGAISVPSNNYGAVWHQECDDCEFADSLIQNIGSASGTQIWSAIEHYSCQGLDVHHNDIDNIRGQGIFEKGETGQQNLGNRYHHNHIRNVHGSNGALFQYIHTTGTTLADASWWYQNLVRDSYAFFRSNYIGTAQTGVVVANNTVARMANWAMYFNNHTHSPLWVVRNNIFFDCVYAYYPEDGTGWTTYASAVDVDRNRHASNTGAMSNDGTRSLAYVQSNYSVDVNGQESSPGFTNAAGNDFTRTFDQLGTDYLSLLGGSSSAAINQGCYILSDQTDRIGRRF